MDRALDPELISLALGPHENLPSPGRLSQLLAEAELALLLRRPELSDELIVAAWYLHAIASSKYALQVYGIERQRAAFKVAGHIFDLLLQLPELNRIHRLKYCFAAQIAYLRSELDPNALAVYQREFASDLAELNLLTHFEEVALSCGVAFLGLDVGYVYRVTRNLRDEVARLVSAWEVEDIFSTLFGAASGVASGTRNLTNFLVYGRVEALELARQLLQRAVLAVPSEEDQISRWVAAHLLNLADDLQRASIWTALPPDIPPNVRKAFAMGHPKILTLWPPQLDLFKVADQQGVNPLSAKVKRLFLSTPTSGGKTLMAQLIIISHLATIKTSVCYVAPTRSLCREVRKSLESRLRFFGKEIVDGLPEGDWLLDLLLDLEPQVEVMTPERLSYLIRSDSSRLLDQFGLFIFDEVHGIGELGRGWTLEEDLSYLHYATLDKDHRIVLMSAAVGNRNHFIQWMARNDENRVLHHHSPWRGPRRLHAIWTTAPNWADAREEITRSKNFPRRVHYPLHGQLDVRISHTGELRSLRTTESIGHLALRYTPEGASQKDGSYSTAFYQMLIPIIQHLSESGPVLVIESTRPQTVRTAQAIADNQEVAEKSEIQSLIDLVEARLGSEHPLWQVLRKGVAYHHGSIPSEIRAGIEDAVAGGYLKFLVATTTMTEGINLPVRSVVVASQGSYGNEGYVEYIKGSKLINAIGRAGRAAKETEGIVVLARNAEPSATDFKRLNPDDSDIEVTSLLATKEALEALAAFEELQRVAEDAIFQIAAGIVSDFLAFIWFVAAESEKLGEIPAQERVRGIFEHTLAWVQLSSENQNRWLSVAVQTLAHYEKTNPSARKRWAATGTSISSAREIESIAQELAEKGEKIEVPQNPIEAVDLIIGEGRLQRILGLPEAPTNRVYTQRAGQGREEVIIPMDMLLRQWLQGAELVSLANSHLNTVRDTDFRFEQLGDFINDYFEIYLPWVFGTIIAWTNDLLLEKGVAVLFPRTIPANIRWGVGNPIALELMIKGIQSRILALKIAESWEKEKRDGDVRSWIRAMNLADWQQTFNASVADLRNLLEFSRNQRGGVAVDLLTQETAKIEVLSNISDFPPSDASLKRIEDLELSPIGIWVDKELVGRVLSRDQADIQSLLNTGLTFSVKFSASSGKGLLELQLVDPEM